MTIFMTDFMTVFMNDILIGIFLGTLTGIITGIILVDYFPKRVDEIEEILTWIWLGNAFILGWIVDHFPKGLDEIEEMLTGWVERETWDMFGIFFEGNLFDYFYNISFLVL
jgi:hypothetical protein